MRQGDGFGLIDRLKAGYAVKIGREKQEGKANAPYVYFVEYWEDEAE